LKALVPDALISELTLATTQKRQRSQKIESHIERKRRPSNFDDYKRALSYALGLLERTVVPGHYNYQVRLKQFLSKKAIVPEFERDFVDVYFILKGVQFIGEIKVTGFLGLSQVFRVALGQLLEYAHLRFDSPPQMVMFLDTAPDPREFSLPRSFQSLLSRRSETNTCS